MPNKKIIRILTALSLILVTVVCFALFGQPKVLSPERKAEILEAYKLEWCLGDLYMDGYMYRVSPLVWFDENGGKRDPYVFRYFGTYGDCIVLLRYGDNQTSLWTPVDVPYQMRGLTRPVYFPMECDVYLYNTNPNYPVYSHCLAPLTELYYVQEIMGVSWLSEAQLKRLTNDLEFWLWLGNY
ncbi:MAG: hypothetical protein IJW94_06430 [Oscillospiraceae bacterium]|nr:hypothetical protein [Oscillospiraceae bacterium]